MKNEYNVACLDSITIIWDHPWVTMFLATILIWTSFSPWMSTFCFCISPSSQTSVKYIFTNIQALCSIFFACERLLESSSPYILGLCETNLGDPIGFSNFSVRYYLPLVQKDSLTHMFGLTVYVKKWLSFTYQLSRNSEVSYLHVWQAFSLSLSFFRYPYQS